MGGPEIGRQFIGAGLVDQIGVHLVPVLFSGGLRLFDQIGDDHIPTRSSRPRNGTTQNPRHQWPDSRAAGVAMAFKLIESAQQRWRCVNAPHLVPLVRAGATFINGNLVERPDDQDQQGGGQRAA
jgi:putative transposase